MKRKYLPVALVFCAIVGLSAVATDPPPDAAPSGRSAPPNTESDAVDFDADSRSLAEKYDALDPAFAKFVNWSLLSSAVSNRGGSPLVDVALAVAAGERVLGRSHRSDLTSDALVAKAAKLAARANDKATLDRIAKAGASQNKPQWVKLVADAKEFAGPSRDGPMVPLAKVDAETIGLLEQVRRACDEAELSGRKSELEELKTQIAESAVDPKVKAHAQELLATGLKSLPEKPDATALVLDEFLAESRQFNWRPHVSWPTVPTGFPSARPGAAPKVSAPGQLQISPPNGKAPPVSAPPSRPSGKPPVVLPGQLQIDVFGGKSRSGAEEANREGADPGEFEDPSRYTEPDEDPSQTPAEVCAALDPAFAKFADFELLGTAVARIDAGTLADFAIGLAEAERVLARAHASGLTADGVMKRAIKLAVLTGDKPTLERIGRAGASANRPQWAKLIGELKELVGPSRDGPTVPLATIDAETVELSLAVTRACNATALARNADELDALKKAVGESGADAKVKAHLVTLIETAAKSAPESDPGTDRVLDEFVAASRSLVGEVVDLKGKGGAKEVSKFLSELAQGNEGEGGIRSLTLNLRTGEVRGSAYVRHRHVWVYGPSWARQRTTAYDWTWNGSFAYNARTRSGHVTLDLGRGVKLNTKDIEALLDGDVGPLLKDPTGQIKKKFRNEYDHIRDSYYRRYGAGNVYFASKRFVDWATPETAGKWVATAIATGGSGAVAQALAETKRKAYEELADIVLWLQRKGVREADSVARQLLEGKRVDWPYFAIKWQTVAYYSQTFVAGNPVTPEIPVRHAAFVLIWRGSPPPARRRVRARVRGAARQPNAEPDGPDARRAQRLQGRG